MRPRYQPGNHFPHLVASQIWLVVLASSNGPTLEAGRRNMNSQPKVTDSFPQDTSANPRCKPWHFWSTVFQNAPCSRTGMILDPKWPSALKVDSCLEMYHRRACRKISRERERGCARAQARMRVWSTWTFGGAAEKAWWGEEGGFGKPHGHLVDILR